MIKMDNRDKFILFIVTAAVTMWAIMPRQYLENITSKSKKQQQKKPEVFSQAQLSKYNGIEDEKLYLSVLGSIFDVTKSKNHYEKGGTYHYFIGKDGSRAFVSGNFKDESANKDHILDLECNDLWTLLNWKEMFKKKYRNVGVLVGRYYDENGKATAYIVQLEEKMKQCQDDKKKSEEKDRLYPPCNMEWSANEGTRVWCTKTSGGISRDWAGVPRQLYGPDEGKPRCVCVDLAKSDSMGKLKEYNNCSKTSSSCIVDVI